MKFDAHLVNLVVFGLDLLNKSINVKETKLFIIFFVTPNLTSYNLSNNTFHLAPSLIPLLLITMCQFNCHEKHCDFFLCG
jgi:hypothetical protein